MKTVLYLSKILLRIDNLEEMNNFLYGLLTPQEIIELNKRIEIVNLLKKGMPQRIIAQKLGVGISTVTRGSSEIQKGNFKYV